MNKKEITITENEAYLIAYSLHLKSNKKEQSLQNLLRRKEQILLSITEEEFNHRVNLRELAIHNAKLLYKKIEHEFNLNLKK